MLSSRQGRVVKVLSQREGISELVVEVEGQLEKAVNYEGLTGEVRPGDRVCLNVTALQLKLGTGGYHFVMANSSNCGWDDDNPGHVMKLRYTPMQIKVQAVEEETSPYREEIEKCVSLGGTPVVVGTLHSMLAPVVAGIRLEGGSGLRVAYVMTDGGALPLAFSQTVPLLRAKGLLGGTITIGHAFGGELEAVNVYSGLLAAKAVLKADVIVVTMGPGIVGTGTRWGFSGVEQGEILNAVNILDGKAIAVPRISFADSRPRHQGLSHHTVTVLKRIALTSVIVPLPVIPVNKMTVLKKEILKTHLHERHEFVLEKGENVLKYLTDIGISPRSMGRSIKEDFDYFLTAGAAGITAAKLVNGAAGELVYFFAQ